MKELQSPRITLLLINSSDLAIQEVHPSNCLSNVKGKEFNRKGDCNSLPTVTLTSVYE